MKKNNKIIIGISVFVIIILLFSLSYSYWNNKNIAMKLLKNEETLQKQIGNEYTVPNNCPFSDVLETIIYIKFPNESEQSELDFYDSAIKKENIPTEENVLTKVCEYRYNNEKIINYMTLNVDPGFIANNKDYNRFSANPSSSGYEIEYKNKVNNVIIKLRKPSSLKSDYPYGTKAFYYKLPNDAVHNSQNYSYYNKENNDIITRFIIFNIGNGIYEIKIRTNKDNIEKLAEDTLKVMLG